MKYIKFKILFFTIQTKNSEKKEVKILDKNPQSVSYWIIIEARNVW